MTDNSSTLGPVRLWPYLILAALVLTADGISKQLALNYLSLYQPLPVFPGLNLRLAFNTGAAFSFLHDAGGWQRWFFVGLSTLVSLVLLVWIRRSQNQPLLFRIALAMITGGAIGNVIDRLIYGHVVDFIDVYYASWHWPAFNIADSAIVMGALIIVWVTWGEKDD
jgi:signal peptidase II